jgi:hypothetical protein
VRQQLEQAQMPVDESPDEDSDSLRHSYNFAPGYHGLVYRADGPDRGGRNHGGDRHEQIKTDMEDVDHGSPVEETKYKLQAMKWGRMSCVLACTAAC